MPNNITLTPSADLFIQSMRHMGYSLNTAVADVIDNSIAAGAKNIDIFFFQTHNPSLMIVDDGHGMSTDKLYEALTFAYMSPLDTRQHDDLGRFGLGLKTASLSQARKLTVVTSMNSNISCAQWDIDYIVETKEWLLKILDLDDVAGLTEEILSKITPHGTIVIWEDIDRLEVSNENDRFGVSETLINLREHLSLIYHKYLSDGYSDNPIAIRLNNNSILPFDPFLSNNLYTVHQPAEKINLDGSSIVIQTHILPHYSKLTKHEEQVLREKSNLLENQGLYIYRNNRLVVWGSWFGLARKSETTKLARVEVNFDNTTDSMWDIDIKKSAVSLPKVITERLKEVIERIKESSGRVVKSRVQKKRFNDDRPWHRVKSRDAVLYKVNREYTAYSEFEKQLSTEQKRRLNIIIDVIESSLPVHSIYSDIAGKPKSIANIDSSTVDEEGLHTKFLDFVNIFVSDKNAIDKDDLLRLSRNTQLFQEIDDKKMNQWIKDYINEL
ncbi:ATP-binding protein [Psychrobacter sanguinis]|uniref:ATP-binding protein n=1 Tax=Psychrobacter sanguinis TaxID=861445 RepID=A0A844M2Z7_9GAMM|nr:ATP-binding protein [Psychrobacter sanguinis]MUG32988.1 ATP-binding protein [Psychrobacter sanguinis]